MEVTSSRRDLLRFGGGTAAALGIARFEFVLHLQTAKALGIDVSPMLLSGCVRTSG
jgi:hypothetical protein